MSAYYPIVCNVMSQTEKAVKIKAILYGREKYLWVPRSLIEEGDDVAEGESEIRVKTWWAEQEGFA